MGDRFWSACIVPVWDFIIGGIRLRKEKAKMRQLVERCPRVDEFFRQQSPFNAPDYILHSVHEKQLSGRDRHSLVTGTYHETHDGLHSIWVIPPVGPWWEINPTIEGGEQRTINPCDIIIWISTTKLATSEPERTVTAYEVPQGGISLPCHPKQEQGQAAAEFERASVFSR